jgi:hypothetical protein
MDSSFDQSHATAVAGLFDAEYYLAINPDVLETGVDPLAHFLTQGWIEGRNPSYDFDVDYYLRRNPDVAASGLNPLVHYALSGAGEGRSMHRPLDAMRRELERGRPSHARLCTADATQIPTIDRVTLTAKLTARLAQFGSLVVSVSHDDYHRRIGGVENVIRDECMVFEQMGRGYLHLSPAVPLPMLADSMGAAEFRFSLRFGPDWLGMVTAQDLIACLADLEGVPALLIIHHLMGQAPELLVELAKICDSRTIVWAHDYFNICISHNLLRNNVRYCGAPSVNSAACTICKYGGDRAEHLGRIRAFMEKVEPVLLAPSETVLDLFLRRGEFSCRAAHVQPLARLVVAHNHREPPRSQPGEPLRIAHLGMRTPTKGWLVFQDLAFRYSKDHSYRFYQLGIPFGGPISNFIKHVDVRVTSERPEFMMEAIAEHRIDVVVSWSLCPETFCFAVHEALAAGAFVLTHAKAGNVPRVIATNASHQGLVLDDEAALFALFENGKLRKLVDGTARRRGVLIGEGGAAGWLRRVPRAGAKSTVQKTSTGTRGEKPLVGSMTKTHCFTSATFAYLDRVRVLVETLRRHHPDWLFWLCLVDQEPPGFVFGPATDGIDHVVRVGELCIPNLRRWLFVHDVVELCTAVKGAMLCKLLATGASKVIYLDPDIAILGSLSDTVALLDTHDIVLTPHLVEPEEDRDWILDNEICSLKHGIYNLGFLAVAGTREGRRFATWWRDRLLHFCFDDLAGGLFTDQRWCDLVPAFFSGVHVLRDPGYNVASWNLSRRPISISDSGEIQAAGQPVRFFHFTKVMDVGEIAIERSSGGRIEVFELMHWYRTRLTAHKVTGLPDGWWAYACYADDTPIEREHRRLYRDRPDLQDRFPDPFLAGPRSFTNA